MSDLPAGWTRTKLGDVADFVVDGDHNPPKRVSDGVPHLTARNVKGGRLVLDRCTFISSEDFVRTGRRYTPAAGDVIVTCVGTLGQTAIVPSGLSFSADRNLAAIRPGEAVQSAFLKAFLDAPAAQDFMRNASGSTAQPHLYLGDLRDLAIPLPPIAEQGRIVVAIDEEFSRIDAGSAGISRAQNQARRQEPAILQSAAARAASSHQKSFVGNLLREPLRNGHSAKANPGGSVPIFTLTAVTSGTFTVANTKLTAADPARVKDLWVAPGDILIERSNTPELVGTTRLYNGPADLAVFPDLVIRARFSNLVRPEYAELIFRAPSSRDYFRRSAQGISGTMPKIDQGIVEQLEISIPPVEIQQQIVEHARIQLDSLVRLRRDLTLANKKVEQLRRSVLAAAVSGKLVQQDPVDEPASALLERMGAERASRSSPRFTRTRKAILPREKAEA